MRGEIGAGVGLLPHIRRRHLRIAEVLLRERLINAARQPFRVVRAGPDLLSFFREDRAGAGVLTHRQNSLRRDFGVLEEGEGDVPIVRARLRIFEDRGDLLEVLRPQHECAVVKGVLRQISQGLGRDLQDVASLEGGHCHAFA